MIWFCACAFVNQMQQALRRLHLRKILLLWQIVTLAVNTSFQAVINREELFFFNGFQYEIFEYAENKSASKTSRQVPDL